MSDTLSLAGQETGSGDDRIAAFAAAYLRRPSDRDGRDEEGLQAEVRGAFALADHRGEAPVAVRAFTPVLAEHGYEVGASVVETNTDDLPFLVDSATMAIEGCGHRVRRVVHPIIGTERDASGRLSRVGRPRDLPQRESVMHFELDSRVAPEDLAAIEDAVRDVLATVRAVVADYVPMRDRMRKLADAIDDEGAAEFLRWLDADHFVYLGNREYRQDPEDGTWSVVDGSGLGLLADCGQSTYTTPQSFDRGGTGLRVAKTNRVAPIHRGERMDDIGVPLPDGSGEARFLGLLGSRAYAEPSSSTPLLAGKLRAILAGEDLVEGSHDYKAAVALFDSFPKDDLFQASADELQLAISTLLGLQPDEVRLLLRRSPDGRSAWAIAALPRASYAAGVRERIKRLLADAFDVAPSTVRVHEVLGQGERVRVHVALHDAGGLPDVDVPALEQRVRELARSWDDQLRSALVGALGEERGRMLAARWAPRLPDSYKAMTAAQVAVGDVQRLEELQRSGGELDVGLQDESGRTRVTFYKQGPKVELSRATPALEHLGLRAIEEHPTRLTGTAETWVQSFITLGPGDRPLDLSVCGERVAAALRAVFAGVTETDSLNRLVVGGGLTAAQVQLLRAYRRYRQRIGSRYTEGFQNDVIADNPEITAKQVRLFELRFDPDRPRDEAAEQALREEIVADLDAVELLDHDRILRNQLAVIEATVRTNVYARGRDAMAFKLRSADVPGVPQPAPLVEVYVYAPDMEGIHLRGGRIARGGLRWSDRMDYRTEVFGLVRAQMTKNAVIVPAGAKGGFFLKQRPDDPSALRDEVRRQYIRYINALLDVTDNLVDGDVVHPDGVRPLDDDDTYLVVAADKGTATFSDTANEIAQRRGFWLGDAFASGGSNGYDHKALGITARGAWESVRRHFRELGKDPESDVLTVVGIGDMSGDVFGNGLLLSRSLKLVAAYDHRHVFLDPDPDPAQSWEERRRLFELPRSSWGDYDQALISEGGGVFPRTAKSIPLTPQVRAALGVEDEALAPTDLIRAVLRAPVDLLWNGGIGTVVKASAETDADAKDRSSDAIRVDADQLRCKVIGEGGNLGLTQRARIEFARGGGLCHADFIDNSAGVDCSDHEVNLKILLDLACRAGELDDEGRTALLREVSDDVTAHVLEDSRLQAQILAQEVQASPGLLYAYDDLLAGLEDEGMLARADESLPSTEELGEHRRSGSGLERPELSVLVAYAKRAITDALLESDLPDEPWIADPELRGYFPPKVVERFGHLLGEHPLRRELVATLVANGVVNALGPSFVSRLVTERGADAAEVVRSYRIAALVVDAQSRWDAVEALDGSLHDRGAYWRLMGGVDALVADVTRWYLAHPPEGDASAAAEQAREGTRAIEAALDELRSDSWCRRRDAEAAGLVTAGVPEELARRHASQPALVHAPDIVACAAGTGRDVRDCAAALFGVGDALALEWLEDEVDALTSSSRLQRWAVQAVRDDLLDVRRVVAEKALSDAPEASPEQAVAAFLEARAGARRRLAAFTRALDLDDGPPDLAGVSLAVRHVRALAR